MNARDPISSQLASTAVFPQHLRPFPLGLSRAIEVLCFLQFIILNPAFPIKDLPPSSHHNTMPSKRHASSTTSAPAASTPTPTPKSLSSGPATLKTNASAAEIAQHVWQQYLATTPQRTLLLDAFMVFLVLVGGLQFLYCILAGNYVSSILLGHFR